MSRRKLHGKDPWHQGTKKTLTSIEELKTLFKEIDIIQNNKKYVDGHAWLQGLTIPTPNELRKKYGEKSNANK